MRETQFIEQNKKKWARFEGVLRSNSRNAEELSNLFIDITDDLSYARTFYTNRSVRVYLNSIAQKVFYSIYTSRSSRLKRFMAFWKDDVPQIIYEARKEMRLSLFIFLGAMLIGVFSTYMDPDFPRVVLGDSYIETTEENIANGEPMAIYQSVESIDMFIMISINNVWVAFKTFLLGLAFLVGTFYILIYNGIMLGAFQSLFIREGIYMESMSTIWLHGTIEISCIIIAGAAGIAAGKGWIFPGTHTRIQSLQLSTRRGLMIMLTITPLIILAAIIESFLTRVATESYVASWVIIGASLLFILSYYVVYPWLKGRKNHLIFAREIELPPSQETTIDYKKVKSVGQVFSDTFQHYRRHLKSNLALAALVTAVYTTIMFLTGIDNVFSSVQFYVDVLEKMFFNIGQFVFPMLTHDTATEGQGLWLMLANMGAASVMVYWWLHTMRKEANIKTGVSYYLNTILGTAIVIGLWHLCLIAHPVLICLFIFFVFPIMTQWLAAIFNEGINVFSALGKAFNNMSWSNMMGSYLVMSLLCSFLLILLTAPLLELYYSILVSALPFDPEVLPTVHEIFHVALHVFVMCMLFPLIFAIGSMQYLSSKESNEANDLMAQIDLIGKKKLSYGMERES